MVGKYLRALERALVVTSTWDEYRVDTYADDANSFNGASLASNQALAHATTPLFSPIPFLQNRSRSQSPTSTLAESPLILDERRSLVGDDRTEQSTSSTGSVAADENAHPSGIGGMSPAMVRNLRVDELDHVSPPLSPPSASAATVDLTRLAVPTTADDRPLSPSQRIGHLAEHPEPFSATTTLSGPNSFRPTGPGLGLSPGPKSPPHRSGAPSPPTLEERFVRESTPEPSPTRGIEEVKRQAAEASANAAEQAASQTKSEIYSNNEATEEEGEVEDVIMKDS